MNIIDANNELANLKWQIKGSVCYLFASKFTIHMTNSSVYYELINISHMFMLDVSWHVRAAWRVRGLSFERK